MKEEIREVLIFSYVNGIQEAMNTCESRLETIKQDFELPCITVAMGVNIESRIS